MTQLINIYSAGTRQANRRRTRPTRCTSTSSSVGMQGSCSPHTACAILASSLPTWRTSSSYRGSGRKGTPPNAYILRHIHVMYSIAYILRHIHVMYSIAYILDHKLIIAVQKMWLTYFTLNYVDDKSLSCFQSVWCRKMNDRWHIVCFMGFINC